MDNYILLAYAQCVCEIHMMNSCGKYVVMWGMGEGLSCGM